jgi:Mg-chelatase subunit ChlD
MNHDETKPDLQSWMDPALEARVIAWVLGEASAFEIAELERLIAESPELGIFKRRIEAVHGLVGEAVRPVRLPLRLSPERRAKVLAVIGAAGTPATDGGAAVKAAVFNVTKKRKGGWRAWVMPIAACVTVGMLLAAMAIPAFQKVRSSSRPIQYLSDATDSARKVVGQESSIEPSSAVGGDQLRMAATGPSNAPSGEVQFDLVASPAPMSAPAAAMPPPASSPEMSESLFRAGGAGSKKANASDGRDGYAWSSASRRITDTEKNMSELNSPSRGNGLAASGRRYAQEELGKSKQVVLGGAVSDDTFYKANKPAASVAPKSVTLSITTGTSQLFAAKELNEPEVPALETQNANLAWDEKITANKSKSEEQANVVATLGDATRLESVSGEVRRRREIRNSTVDYFAAPAEQEAGAFAADGPRVGGEATRTAQLRPNDRGELLGEVAVAWQRPGVSGDTSTRSNAEAAVDSLGLLAGSNTYTGATTVNGGGPVLGHALVGALKNDAAQPVAQLLVTELDADKAPAKPVTPVADESLRAEVSAANEAVSTFSLHVSDASYRLARAALARGEAPDAATIRPEEFYNAFDYGDAAPAAGEPVAGRIEQAAHPFLQQRNLVRIALRVPAAGRGAGTALHLTVLLDTSGSMEREDRAATVRAALGALAGLLGPNDRVTLIGFARQPRLLVESLPGDQAEQLVELAANTPAEGGTNLEEALRLAGDLARRQFLAGAQNRIVLLTDGAANLGDADPARLMAQVEELRRQGVAFDACGVGAAGLDDTVLESLTRKGDGRYQVLNSPEEADAGFARKLAGAFRPAAENVKVQVRFNPARVGRYRLIGFEKHRLREEDFRNDKVDAAELAAEEAAVALYQVEVLPGGEGELGDVAVRFRDAARGEMVERTWTLDYVAQPPAFDKASPSLRLAGASALLAEKLRGGSVGGQIRIEELAPVVAGLRSAYAGDARVQDFIAMFAQARRLTGE